MNLFATISATWPDYPRDKLLEALREARRLAEMPEAPEGALEELLWFATAAAADARNALFARLGGQTDFKANLASLTLAVCLLSRDLEVLRRTTVDFAGLVGMPVHHFTLSPEATHG